MEETNKYIDKPAFQEEESSFNIMEWVMLFVSHWYLFLFSLAIMLTFAYLQNRKWQPEYKSSGTVIIAVRTVGVSDWKRPRRMPP